MLYAGGWVDRQEKELAFDFLAPHAPELNPVENVWNYLKSNSMASEALFDLESLSKAACRPGRLQRQPGFLRSFMKHTPLFLRLR